MLRGVVRISVLGFLGMGLTVACTITSGDSETSSGGSPRSDAGTVGSDAGGSSDRDGGDAGATANACRAQVDQFTCIDCCGGQSSAVAKAEEAFDTCACNGPCATACTSFCADRATKPSDACIECLAGETAGRACDPEYERVCNADPACVAVEACVVSAGCNDKPPPGDGGR